MVLHTERKIAEVHQRLDAFELRVLAGTAPQVDVSTLQAAVKSLRTDIDMILESMVPEYEAPSIEPIEDTVMAALFVSSEIPPPPLQRMPRGIGVETRMRLEHGRWRALRWRLRGEPRLLMRSRVG